MEAKWTIGEVAKLFDISTDTLRYYEKNGLLSAEKNETNGYRYYSYETIVILMDILFFRNMDVPVKDIRHIVATMGISDIKDILAEHQRSMENKIQELTKQSQMLAQVALQYEQCEKLLGEYSIVSAPDFKYKVMGKHDEDLFDIIGRYKKMDAKWMNNIRYSLLVPQDELMRSKSFHYAQLGLSIETNQAGMLSVAEQRELSSMSGAEYLYTIVSTDYNGQANHTILNALSWLNEENRQVTGPLVGRYMASSHKDGLDYYEIWIEVR